MSHALSAEAGEQGIAQRSDSWNSDLRLPEHVLPNFFNLMDLVFLLQTRTGKLMIHFSVKKKNGHHSAYMWLCVIPGQLSIRFQKRDLTYKTDLLGHHKASSNLRMSSLLRKNKQNLPILVIIS